MLDQRNGTLRLLSNDYLFQNSYDTARKQSTAAFTFALAGLARAYTTNINDVLCIGMGVGIVPMDFARRGARVDVRRDQSRHGAGRRPVLRPRTGQAAHHH